LSEPFEDAESSAHSFTNLWSGLVTITAEASCRDWGFLEHALSEF